MALLGINGKISDTNKGTAPAMRVFTNITPIDQRRSGLESVRSIAGRLPGELWVSKQKLRQAEAIRLVRVNRENRTQNLGFASRPFVLCGLPIKRPRKGVLLHERRNGQFLLQVTGHPKYGAP
jgi:hypothetical protein